MTVSIVNRWRVELPRHPSRLNDLMRKGWRHGWRLGKKDKQMVALACRVARVPPAEGKRRVSLHVTLGPRQRMDPDCLWKATLDSLKACGALRSDDRKWCELGEVTFDRGPSPSAVIMLEDC